MRAFRQPTQRGFTLIELLVVIAVIGVLVAMIMPAVQQARERARAVQCRSNLKQLGIALHNYESTHKLFPPSFIRQEDGNPPPPAGAGFASLRYRSHWTGFHMLLPFMDQTPLYEKYDFSGTWLSSMTDATDRRCWPLNQTVLPLLVCPSSPHLSLTIGAPTGGDPNFIITGDDLSTQGTPGAGQHWMAGSPTDYSFSHGADIIRALPGSGEEACAGGLLHYWSKYPKHTRGAFGYSSSCRMSDLRDGSSQSIFLGEKGGGLLTYSGWNGSFPKLSVEFPWAMAAVIYFAPTGNGSDNSSFWVVGPFGVTADFKLPQCADAAAGSGQAYPINPFPREVPFSSNERPFYSFQSAHHSGAFFLFGDGSVKFLSNSINQRVYEALSTIAGKELVNGDSY